MGLFVYDGRCAPLEIALSGRVADRLEAAVRLARGLELDLDVERAVNKALESFLEDVEKDLVRAARDLPDVPGSPGAPGSPDAPDAPDAPSDSGAAVDSSAAHSGPAIASGADADSRP
ncbi:MAG: hypothetical protein H0S85_00915 [Desulfovibrionaceae bacterium]|jgi:hypothetical protein|nr:hypothetical protein [Desulfovibrionaceae bacterium]